MRVLVVGALCLLTVGPGARPQSERPTFPLQVVSAAASGSLSGVHAADIDRDGDLDLVTARPGHLTVQLGDGHGYFPESVETLVALETWGLAVGDIDADGLPDVALSSLSDGGIQILLGGGDGAFSLAMTVPIGPNPREPVLADFNADGRLDLAVGRVAGSALSVALGDEDDGFLAATTYAIAGTNAEDLAAADLDQDGDVDLVIAFAVTAGVQVFRNDGSGAFVSEPLLATPSPPADILVADLTEDGRADLVVSMVNGSPVRLFAGQPSGAFAPAQAWGPAITESGNARELAAADIDGDGDLDLAVAGAEILSDDDVRLLLNQGGTSATLVTTQTGRPNGPLALADVNRDGRIDLLAAGFGGVPGVTVVLNALDPLFEQATELKLPSLSIRAIDSGDVDGDGLPEIVAMCSAPGGNAEIVALATPSLTVVAQSPINLSGDVPASLWVGDLDGDLLADTVAHDRSADTVVIVPGQAGGGFGAPLVVATAVDPTFVTGGDLDADGDLDLVTVHEFAPGVAVLWNDGQAGFSAPQSIVVPAQPKRVVLGDLDADDIDDMVVAHSTGSKLSLLFGAGSHAFDPIVPFVTDKTPLDLVIADLDQDGDADLALGDVDALRLVHGIGDGQFTTVAVIPDGAQFRVDVGDVDGDGLPDLVTDSGSGEEILVYASDPFAPQSAFWAKDDAHGSLLLDVDHDGLLDLALCNTVLEVHWNVSDQSGPLAQVGAGLAGATGTPHWSGLGVLEPMTPLALSLAHAKPGAPLTLVLGFSLLEASFKGGTMVPLPQLLLAGLSTNATGGLALSTTWPAGIPSGFLLATQCWIVDASGPAGLTASNGLVLTTP